MYKSKYGKFIFTLMSLCIIFSACKNSNNDSVNRSLKITGYFPNPFSHFFYSEDLKDNIFIHSIMPSEVAKVIVFSGNYKNFYVETVQNGSFSVNVDRDKPYGIVFANNANQFLGYLYFGNNINALPVQLIDKSINTVNLGALLSNNNEIKPEENPIGKQIILSEDEIKVLAQANSFFCSIVQNPDADGDGIVDILTSTYYTIHVQYGVDGGSFNGSLTPTVNQSTNVMAGFKLMLFVYDSNGNFPSDYYVKWNGPENSGLANLSSSGKIVFNNTQVGYWSQNVSNPTYPPGGVYTIQYATKTLTFNVPDQSQAPDNVILCVPTVTLNNDNTIKSISWKYRRPGSTEEVNPKVVLDSVMIQIYGTGPQCPVDPQHPDQIYQSGWIDASITSHELKCQNHVLWNNVTGIGMCYNDTFGNHYVVTFKK